MGDKNRMLFLECEIPATCPPDTHTSSHICTHDPPDAAPLYDIMETLGPGVVNRGGPLGAGFGGCTCL